MQDNFQNKADYLIKTFGKIVKKHRLNQEKSIYKISAEASIPKATWREIEHGLKNFGFVSFWKIAEGLDISPTDLIEELRKELGSDFNLSDFD